MLRLAFPLTSLGRMQTMLVGTTDKSSLKTRRCLLFFKCCLEALEGARSSAAFLPASPALPGWLHVSHARMRLKSYSLFPWRRCRFHSQTRVRDRGNCGLFSKNVISLAGLFLQEAETWYQPIPSLKMGHLLRTPGDLQRPP